MSASWPPVGDGNARSAGGNGGTSTNTSTNASATTSNGSSSKLLHGCRAPLGRLPWKPTCSRRVLPSDYEAISLLINPPRVIFDNTVNPSSTVLKVDSANRHGCLLEVVQLLTDLGLIINKAFISSDGGWFMDG